jgi:putative FmdB family regulatory protein
MPLYEYVCRECESRFDRLSSHDEADAASCPECGADEAKRLLSVIGGLGGRAEAPAPACGGGACAACS